jgi:linoleoyl-CoA desaturase
MQKVTFKSDTNLFYATLRREVDQYFENKKIAKTGTSQLYLKTVVFLSLSVLFYVWAVFFTPASTLLAFTLCVLMGLNSAFIGFNVMHDASHGSYSPNGRLCNILAHTMNYLGSSAYFWNTKHNVLHHTYTNIDGVDSDIVQTKLLRLAPTQQWRAMHRFQHLYALPLYALSHAAWILYNDFEKYFTQKVLNLQLKNFSVQQHIIFWVTKLLYITFYFALPIYMVGLVPALVGFAILSAACGITLTVVFQLAHVVEITEFEDGTDGVEIESEWAVHQINTTANFATDNKIVSWFLGGLNFQVEHHLFPKISHVHYPALQKIVQQTCAQFGVQYRTFPTMTSAVASHFRMLRYMGSMEHIPRLATAEQRLEMA